MSKFDWLIIASILCILATLLSISYKAGYKDATIEHLQQQNQTYTEVLKSKLAICNAYEEGKSAPPAKK